MNFDDRVVIEQFSKELDGTKGVLKGVHDITSDSVYQYVLLNWAIRDEKGLRQIAIVPECCLKVTE